MYYYTYLLTPAVPLDILYPDTRQRRLIMSVSNKIKGLLSTSGKSQTELARFLGISPQSLSNKMTRGYFSADDLIRIGVFCSRKLSYTFPDGSEIIFTKQDLPAD